MKNGNDLRSIVCRKLYFCVRKQYFADNSKVSITCPNSAGYVSVLQIINTNSIVAKNDPWKLFTRYPFRTRRSTVPRRISYLLNPYLIIMLSSEKRLSGMAVFIDFDVQSRARVEYILTPCYWNIYLNVSRLFWLLISWSCKVLGQKCSSMFKRVFWLF